MSPRLTGTALALYLTLTIVAGAAAQTSDSLIVVGEPVATFLRAGRMSTAPDGRIFVTDRDRNTVDVLGPDGHLLERVGGPGVEEGRFDDPADVDAGIGLIISVADAGNGRIQRFSNAFRFLESLPVGRTDVPDASADDPSFRSGVAGVGLPPDGRPIALTTSSNDDLYAVDANSNRVYRWDRARRRQWSIGDDGDSRGTLSEPIDLSVYADLVFVADTGCACIVVFDLFGTYVRMIADGDLLDVRSVDASEDGLLVLAGKRVMLFDPQGKQLFEQRVGLDERIIGAALFRGRIRLLTEKALYLAPL
jgi:hypothetical protein